MSKMDMKRRSEVSADSDCPAKKDKAAEFNGTVFKAMLKEPGTAMKGLEKFTSTAKRLPSSDLYDVVEGYIKISMECAEIFKLLDGDKHPETELLLIFESLEVILLRTASDLSHFKVVGNAIVKKIVSSHMKLLQTSFHSESHRFVRQCLTFLSALVSQGPGAAREVFSHIHISRSLCGLAKRKDKRGRPDVRQAFIQFVLSFLVAGDNATVGHVLESRELLPEILNTGLKEDRMSTVNLILSTLKTRVVLNKGMSKTQKVHFFTPAVLANVASLYKWNGIVDATTDDDRMSDNNELAGISVVRELAHSFLLELCCSRKHGISFHDASLGTAGRAGNIVLLQFLVGLKQATEDELVAELLVDVLKSSPDVLTRYFKETQHSYTPRLKSAWQDNVKLLKKIYEAQPDISTIFQGREVVPPSRLLSMMLVTSLPPVCNKAFFSQALSLANTTAQLTTLSMMNFLLKKAKKNIEYLLDKSVWCNSDLYRSDMMEDLVQQYRETLSKIMPDMTSIIGKWQSLSKKEKMDDEEKRSKTAESSGPTEPGAETAEVILLKALILQVICMYQKVVPHLVSQCKFDFSKLLKGIVSEQGMREEVPPVLQQQILQLALDLPASKFSWFRIQDAADKDSPSAEKSVLYLLLKMFVSSGHLKTSTQNLVLKVLKDSGVFEHTWTELQLWLHHLTGQEPNQQETVIQFLEKVLGRLVCNSHVYTDKVAGVVQEAGLLQANLSNQEGDAASVPVSHIDDVLDMLDVIMEGNDGEMEEFGPPLSDDIIIQTFPFSVVVPAALEARNKLPADRGVVYEYLSSVLSDVLHSQRDPLPLCLALQRYDKELESLQTPAPPHPSVVRLHHYYSKWLPRPCREDLFKSCECHLKEVSPPSCYSAVMKAAYIQGPNAILQDAFRENVKEALTSMSTGEFPVAAKQILLYIRSTVENFGSFSKDSGTDLLKVLMEMLQDLVIRLRDCQETKVTEPAAPKPPEESELFLEFNQSSEGETDKEQVLASVLGSILKHPCLEQWFLSLELSSLPPHSLNPVRLKLLCSQMADDTLALLRISAASLCGLGRLDLLDGYTAAVERAAVKELMESSSQPPQTHSRSFQALLALHSFMAPSSLREVVSKLLLLPHDSLISSSSKGTPAELTVYGQAVLQILTECKSASPGDVDAFLSPAHLQGLGTLLLSCSSPALEAFLLQTLTAEPGSANLIHTDVLLHCLQRAHVDSLAVGSLLLQHGAAHRLRLEVWSLEPGNMERLTDQDRVFLGVINTYLQVAGGDDPARPKDVQEDVLRGLKKSLFSKLTRLVLGDLSEESSTLLTETLAALIRLSSNANDIRGFIDDLPAALQKVDSFQRWQLVDAINEKLAGCPEELETWRKSAAAAAVKCLTASYSRSKDQTDAPSDQEHHVLATLTQLLLANVCVILQKSAGDVTASEWNSFIKNGLKYRYRDRHFLSTLRSLLDLMYSGDEAQKELLPLSTLHMMASSHSLFLPTMLEADEGQTQCEAKEELVTLLLCLVKKCPAVCNMNHFVILLGAYGATLSTSDQKLLLLLQEYEKHQISLLNYQSFMWGPAAVEHHKTRKSLGASLWKQAGSDEVLALLKTDKMFQTIRNFPQQRRIIPQDDMELYESIAVKDLGNLYDPCFLLPLFSAILRPECVIDCLKFVSSHALGATVASLSSYDPKVRAAAYHVLDCFCHHVEGARFREKRQLLYLMDMVKNGIRQPNQRLPFVLTTYVSKVAQQMLKPEDHMYVVLNRFLLSHQSLDFRRVPEFFKLFYSFDLEHKMEREWILGVLEEGISDGHCYQLCNQQSIFQVLMGFSSSPLCDEHFQAQIIRVLCKAASVTRAACNLTKSSGLLTWMMQVLEKRNLDLQLLGAIIELLHVLWFTNLRQKEKQAGGGEMSSSTKDEPPSSARRLSVPLVAEFLSVASTICRHLRLGVKASQLRLFLQTLHSALKHRRATLSANQHAERLALRPQSLSCTQALSLLLSWAHSSHNATLLTQIQALSDKHKVKELKGIGRDRVRGRSSGSQVRSGKENQSEDSEAERQEQSELAECKLLLGSICVHWEPSTELGESRQDCSQLACDTAHLLVRWSLRVLVEQTYDQSRASEFLHWVEKSVMKHRRIVEAVLPDLGLRADLLRLYHRVLQAQRDTSISGRVETLQLFTNIMICFLESRGPVPELHGAVISACVPEAAQDPSQLEAGLCLLSLYIHELWSGASSPELFLTHVTLVTRIKSKKQKCSPAAIRTICNEIIKKIN